MDFDAYYEGIEDYLPLAGRLLLGAFFVFQGITKATGGISGFATYVESLGIPAATAVAALVVAIEVVGGLALLTGFKTRAVGLFLGVYLVAVNLVAHPFWAEPDQLSVFMKNTGLIGGLLLSSVVDTGKYSLEVYLE